MSYAGRLELINSTLNTMHMYWSAIFKIPATTSDQIEKMCRRFLCRGSDIIKKRNPMAWKVVCKPKDEGLLGIRRIRDWNKAALSHLCF